MKKKTATFINKPARKLLTVIVGVGIFFISVASVVFYRSIVVELPKIERIDVLPPLSSKIVDNQGQVLYIFYKDENRTWVRLDQIPQSLIWATISIEDKEFYTHSGLSFKGLARAILYNISNKGGLRGGSTITQQLVKNVFLSAEKTWKRKIKEGILAFLLELRQNKNQILERYFNQVSYGGDAYGVEEASLRYFGKHVWEINMAEATFLAGLPAAPSLFSPFRDIEMAKSRQKHVLEEMVRAGYISFDNAQTALKTKIEIINNPSSIKWPHFVFFVRDYVENELGLTDIERKGLIITTSIDSQIQKMAEEIVADEVTKNKGLKISNGAAIVTETKTGQILAMVGSKNYWAEDIDGKYNITTALRQPGSMIKPINYSLALIRGRKIYSTIEDSPISYKINGQKDYVPKNYNGKYLGKVTLRQALACSLNIPSVKILNENGVGNMIDLAEKMGITTWRDRSRFGLSLALGAGEIKMVEIAEAYSTLANLGYKVKLNPVLEITDHSGKQIYKAKAEGEAVMEDKVAFLINDVLSDDSARKAIFGSGSMLNIKNKKVAVKTGTTNNLRDNWCIGWTPSLMVAGWVGNNNNQPMSWVASGISGATPIWNRIMTKLLANKPREDWQVPDQLEKVNTCGRYEYIEKGSNDRPTCQVTPTNSP